jgi:hypothetical protein
LLYDQGWTYQEIADALLLSEGAIKQHLQDYQSSNKLKPENGGSVSIHLVVQALGFGKGNARLSG